MLYCIRCKSTSCQAIQLRLKNGYTYINGIKIQVGICDKTTNKTDKPYEAKGE